MRTFRGRITRTDENQFIVEDSDSETDSEVEPIYTAGNFDIFIDGDLLEDSEDDTTESDPDVDEDPFAPVDDELEDISLEGYFAFGGRLRNRFRGGSQDSIELPLFLPNNQLAQSPNQSFQADGTFGRLQVDDADAVVNRTLEELRRLSDRPDRRLGFSELITFPMLGSLGVSPEVDSSNSNDNIITLSTGTNNERVESPRSIHINGSYPVLHYLNAAAAARANVDTSDTSEGTSTTTTKSDARTDIMENELTEIDGDRDRAQTPLEHKHGQNNDCGVSESGESERTDDKEEETCNPMVSDVEELEDDDALRGDRIGSTTYSERHVLKILMKWVQELPKYSEDGVKENEEIIASSSTASTIVDKSRFLEPDFEEEMALLWDMSYEPDVMSFLVENNAFSIIRETLDVSHCARLTEIALGILTNIISQQSIVEDFSIHDASLKLVETVIELAIKMPRVPVLIQIFAVLRRITWFLGNVALVQKWMDLLISQEFLNCSNFIMSSSTNALLLGNVIVTLFSALEALGPETEKDAEVDESGEPVTEKESSYFFGKALQGKKKYFENYRPFCETGFVPSLCEGLTELLKNPKPRKVQKLTSTHDRDKSNKADDATDERTLDDMELPIPDGLVQNAILNGLSSFFYLYKTSNGKEIIRENHSIVLNILLNLFRKFFLCTDDVNRSSTLDYYALAINLLTFCHKEVGELSLEALKVPVATGSQLMDVEGDQQIRIQEKDGTERDSKTFIALVVHEYFASLADNFGQELITEFKTQSKHKKFLQLVDEIVSEVSATDGEQVYSGAEQFGTSPAQVPFRKGDQ